MKTLRLTLALIITLVTLSLSGAVHTTEAKGPAEKVTISGPGLDSPIEIEDEDALESLLFAQFMEFGEWIDPPATLGPGFHLVRYFKRDDGTYMPFIEDRYYPDPAGGPGAIHILGIVNGASDQDGWWFRPRPEADAQLRELLADHGAILPAAASPLEPAVLVAEGTGTLRLFDPASLDERTAVQLWEGWQAVLDIVADPTGRAVYIYTADMGVTNQYAWDLAAQTGCLLSHQERVVMATFDGQLLVDPSGDGLAPESLEIRDAATFALEHTIPLPVAAERALTFASPDHQRAYLLLITADAASLYLLDVTTRQFIREVPLRDVQLDGTFRGTWDPSGYEFFLTDGEQLFTADARMGHMGSAIQTPLPLYAAGRVPLAQHGTWLEAAVAQNTRLWLYHPLGRPWMYDVDAAGRGDIDGGVFKVHGNIGRVESHMQTGRAFAQVVYGGGLFYGLEAPQEADQSRLVAFEDESGNVLASAAVSSDSWRIGYVRLDPALLPTGGGTLPVSTCPGPEPAPVEAAILPVTATPAP